MQSAKSNISDSDKQVMDLLRKSDGLRIPDLASALQVTATAVRQRLNRLMAAGLIERSATSEGRGRPSHEYRLSDAGRRQTGSNFTDLAVALWQEVRLIQDVEVRRGLMQRLSKRMAGFYADKIAGETVADRMHSVARMLNERDVPFEVQSRPASSAGNEMLDSTADPNALPVLTALGCPYTELAEQDRSICSMERMLFGELLGQRLSLSQCRLDGASCCTFEVSGGSN
ncbi:MAG: MarR family transcriptional regulator [Planctomycetota bacterium]